MKLTTCASCHRLVRHSDASCPFCKAAVLHPTASPISSRVRRGLMLAGAAAISAGCGSTAVPVYGGPPADAAADTDSGPVAMYGGPPVDAGLDARDSGPDATIAAYGLPPIDAGKD